MSVKNEKYLYVSGCSYTYGIGIDPDYLQEKRWASLLGRKLNLDVLNSACPGSSNFRITRHTFKDILTREKLPELGIIMWSDPPRQEFFRPPENEYGWLDLAQVTPQGVNGIKSFYHKDAFESFFTFINTEERALVQTLNHMLSVEMLFKAHNIPVIHLHFKSNLNRYYRHLFLKHGDTKEGTYANLISHVRELVSYFERTNKHVFGFTRDESFQKLMQENKIETSKISLGHPEEQGHFKMAEWLYDYIVGDYDLSERLQLHIR